MTKKDWLESLKAWRHDHEEYYARQLMGEPQHTTLTRAIPQVGRILVMGDQGQGKTALGHAIAEMAHTRHNLPAVCHVEGAPEPFKQKLKSQLPRWIKVTSSRSDWPQNSIIIYDETSRSAHARRSQSREAVDLEEIMGATRQRGQLIIFISHQSTKLDIQVVRDITCICYKCPTYAHAIFEREEISDLTYKALEFFGNIKGEKTRKRTNLLIDFRTFQFFTFVNGLPSWWSEKLSCLFKDLELSNHNGNGNTMRGVLK